MYVQWNHYQKSDRENWNENSVLTSTKLENFV